MPVDDWFCVNALALMITVGPVDLRTLNPKKRYQNLGYGSFEIVGKTSESNPLAPRITGQRIKPYKR